MRAAIGAIVNIGDLAPACFQALLQGGAGPHVVNLNDADKIPIDFQSTRSKPGDRRWPRAEEPVITPSNRRSDSTAAGGISCARRPHGRQLPSPTRPGEPWTTC
jgi:hypothetical protein